MSVGIYPMGHLVRLHMLFLNEAYERADAGLLFRRVSAPTSVQLSQLLDTLSRGTGRYLEKQGWLQRDEQSVYLHLLQTLIAWTGCAAT